MIRKILTGILLVLVVDAFIFPVRLNFFSAINSKMAMALIGGFVFAFKCIHSHEVKVPTRIVVSALLAILFSLWCLFSITENGTDQTVYVSYWSSFATWLFGAYGVYVVFKAVKGECDLASITKFLSIVCVGQCALALLIDNVPMVRSIVHSLFFEQYGFYERAGRLYGVGCALDTAGVRFAAILILITHQIVVNRNVYENRFSMLGTLAAFIIITVIGSMISRTTSVGAVIALAYLLVRYATVKKGGYISRKQIMMFLSLFALIFLSVLVFSALYNSSSDTRSHLRFAFEGFFNWVETGEFRTTSTDILMNDMWIWPDNFHDWMIGTGLYGVFSWGTDIGYCNFVLYCGLIGLAIFSFFFIYTSLSLNTKFKDFMLLSLLLIALQAVIWVKVATDIFCILSLLMVIDGDIVEISEDKPVHDNSVIAEDPRL